MITGLDLAQWSRILLHDRAKQSVHFNYAVSHFSDWIWVSPKIWRYATLWPLYIFAEIAM